MIKAVLFDLDGVLCDLREVHYAAFNYSLVSHGYEGIDRKAHRCTFNGLPTREKLRLLVGAGKVRENDVESITSLKQRETIEKACTVPFDPDVYCLLAGISRGWVVGLVSNAVRDTVVSAIQTMAIHDFFGVVVTNEDGRHKPAPDLYLKACRDLHLPPAECLAVEDCEYGVDAARAAGCPVLAVTAPSDLTPRLVWRYLTQC